jgi:hypothetical protein
VDISIHDEYYKIFHKRISNCNNLGSFNAFFLVSLDFLCAILRIPFILFWCFLNVAVALHPPV